MGGLICIDVVQTGEVGVIQHCGKFARLAEAGPNCVCWPLGYCIAGKVSLRVQELRVTVNTKTHDNVFVDVNISVQYQAVRDKVYAAYYKLADHEQQMRSYVFDTVRSSLCTMTLDQSFEAKDEISTAVKAHLQEVMSVYGYSIMNALVTDLTPDQRVRDAMNEINSSKRLKEAAVQRAEGEKILKVKRAEGEAESMYLSGVGVANQRRAIMNGLRESVVEFADKVDGTKTKDIMDLLVLTQYMDTLTEVGHRKDTKCILLPNDVNPVRSGMLQAQQVF